MTLRSMKYMGSKRVMLANGLGDVLTEETKSATRFVDLFCGAGVVSWFVATSRELPVLSCDLQSFATTMAASVVKRTDNKGLDQEIKSWTCRVRDDRKELLGWSEAENLDRSQVPIAVWWKEAQELCGKAESKELGPVWRHYGGHYFSPTQAMSLDAMIKTLPAKRRARDVCLAATIMTAIQCAAAPGHTAQPFKATVTAGPYLREAWRRDPLSLVGQALEVLVSMSALRRGDTRTGDANEIACDVTKDDLVFVDPPYSNVQYSRFYHVLETIARGHCGEVVGVGRYPPPDERPSSDYSRVRDSAAAMENLLEILAGTGATVVVTFPEDQCSNGLSGVRIEEMAKQHFQVVKRSVTSRFSTLGGNTRNRDARSIRNELILVMRP